jgi:hypothetical protein
MSTIVIRLALAAIVLLGVGGREGRAQMSPLRFAVIGDYGLAGTPLADVAVLIKSWNPELIITTGDNNYYDGAASTIDANIGQYFAEFIYPYVGQYGAGGTVNRFFPSLGNHDWEAPGAQPYLDYFTLPGNERYYDFVWGPVHFFAIDSDNDEPDRVSATSVQATWLKTRLATSTAPWKLVYFHHPPYSSGPHGSSSALRWPFAAWGADAVLTGHDHVYERVTLDDFPYFVNGLGGGSRSTHFDAPVVGSQVRFRDDFGAMRVEATAERITFEFVTRAGVLIDRYTLYTSPDAHLPDGPGNLTATGISSREIDLAWTDNASNETGFRIDQWTGTSWMTAATVGPNVTTYRVEGLAPLTRYDFRVVAIGVAGTSVQATTATGQTIGLALPTAPSGLTAQVVSSSRIDLAWTDNATNESGFAIEQSTNGSTFTQAATVGANVRTRSILGLAGDTSYFFRLRAYNADGFSAYSNVVSARTASAAAMPDLVITTVSNPVASAMPGGSFSASDTVTNQGSGTAAASSTRYYLSLDAIRNSSDIRLTGSRGVGSLASGGTSSGSVTVTVPSTTAAGTYRLLACADDLGQVAEGSETNNCRASSTAVQISVPTNGADLVVTALYEPPARSAAGGNFVTRDTVQNQGSGTAGSSVTRFYLSEDAVRGGADILLSGTHGVPSLNAGQSYTKSLTLSIPASTPVGLYYLLACADDTGQIAEANETNNCRISQRQVELR